MVPENLGKISLPGEEKKCKGEWRIDRQQYRKEEERQKTKTKKDKEKTMEGKGRKVEEIKGKGRKNNTEQ